MLAKYDVKQHDFQENELHEEVNKKYDLRFHPEDCREELEVSFMYKSLHLRIAHHYKLQLSY